MLILGENYIRSVPMLSSIFTSVSEVYECACGEGLCRSGLELEPGRMAPLGRAGRHTHGSLGELAPPAAAFVAVSEAWQSGWVRITRYPEVIYPGGGKLPIFLLNCPMAADAAAISEDEN